MLIPLFERAGRLHVAFGKRSDELRRHRGEIAFPGGVPEDDDVDLLSAAMREAREEAGITSATILGMLDDVDTHSSGYVIRPFVGVVSPPFVPDGREIVRILECPIDDVAATHRTEVWSGRTIHFYEAAEEVVWGATARILHALLALL